LKYKEGFYIIDKEITEKEGGFKTTGF